VHVKLPAETRVQRGVAPEHRRPQAPQSVVEPRYVSQPPDGSLSQLPQPALQIEPHTPPEQPGLVRFCPLQARPHTPQLRPSVRTLKHVPGVHSARPEGHTHAPEPLHTPLLSSAHDPEVRGVALQINPVAPQIMVPICRHPTEPAEVHEEPTAMQVPLQIDVPGLQLQLPPEQ